MKKIIFIITMMCACLFVNAQVWDTAREKSNDVFGSVLGKMYCCEHKVPNVNNQYFFMFENICL